MPLVTTVGITILSLQLAGPPLPLYPDMDTEHLPHSLVLETMCYQLCDQR